MEIANRRPYERKHNRMCFGPEYVQLNATGCRVDGLFIVLHSLPYRELPIRHAQNDRAIVSAHLYLLLCTTDRILTFITDRIFHPEPIRFRKCFSTMELPRSFPLEKIRKDARKKTEKGGAEHCHVAAESIYSFQ